MRAASRLTMLLVLLAACLVLAPSAGARQAAPAGACTSSAGYPPRPGAQLQVSTTSASVGARLEVSGSHFCANETITIRIGSTVVGSAHSDAAGAFDPPVVVPGPTGRTQVCAQGESGLGTDRDCVKLTVRAAAAVTAPTSSNGGGTAFTGVRIALLAALALLLMAGGVAFTAAGRTSKPSAV